MPETPEPQEHRLEALLRSRRIEPASPDLVEIILLQTWGIPQNQTMSLIQWMKRLFREFHLPRPAYVFVGLLLLGIVVGLNSPLDRSTDDADTMQVQSFLYADEDML